MGRGRATAGRRWGMLLLVVVLLVPGTPDLLLRQHAEQLAQQRVLGAAAPGRNALPERRERHQAAPPSPSGAFPTYPLNSTFDGDPMLVGTPPTNFDFETAGYEVGSPPTNYDFETAPNDMGTPSNYDFNTGDFTDWLPTGSPTIQSDASHGYYARFSGTASLTTAQINVGSAAQAFVIDVFWSSCGGMKVHALTGTGFTTSTEIATINRASDCSGWHEYTIRATSYQNNPVKLKFVRHNGTIAFDRVRTEEIAPGYILTGSFGREVDGGNTTLRLSGSATTPEFTVDSDTQHGLIVAREFSGSSSIEVHILSGPTFSSDATVLRYSLPDNPLVYQFPLFDWQDQIIKIRVETVTGTIAIDDVGVQRVDVHGWTMSNRGTTWSTNPSGVLMEDGDGYGGGNAISVRNERLISPEFTMPANAQQISIKLKSDGSTTGTDVWIELLTGPTFSQVVNLNGGPTVGAGSTDWRIFQASIGNYADQPVKLQIRPDTGRMLIDDAGFIGHVAPGWTPLAGYPAITVLEDTNGTYLTSQTSGGSFEVTSAMVCAGVVDDTSKTDAKSVSFAYAFGTGGSGRMTVWWVPVTGGTPGTPIQVYDKLTDSTQTLKDARFKLLDSYVQTGYYKIKGTGGARVYAIADNVARQQLGEPFSMQVGVGIDTSTGSFGWAETDVTVEGGAMPLAFTRYYSGHSDRLGPMGYRWRHSYDTELYIGVSQNPVVVLFGDGTEEAFAKQVNGTYLPDDARIKATLEVQTIGVDTFYVYTTKDRMVYTFSDLGLLESIADPNDNTIDLAYDVNDRLETVSTAGGQSLTLAYDTNGHLASVTGTGGETATYEYHVTTGDLAAVERPDDTDVTERMEYVYSRHRIRQVRQRQGKDLLTNPTIEVVVSNTLDSYNRVTQQTDATGGSLRIAYQDPAAGVTTVKDRTAAGAETEFHFDGYGRTTHIVTPLAQVTQYVYDNLGNMTKWIDGGGAEYEFHYEADGDIDWVDDPLDRRTNISFNAQHLPTTITDALGIVTTNAYDGDGNHTEQVVDVGDPGEGHLNLKTIWEYDEDGNRTREVIDPGDPEDDHLNLTTSYGYNSAGQMTSRIVDPDDLDNPAPDPLNLTWTYTYTSKGLLKTETDPEGVTTFYEYTGKGRLRMVHVDPDVAPNTRPAPYLDLTTRYVYDLVGNLIVARDPVCFATGLNAGDCQVEWYYDERGLVTDKYDGEGTRFHYEYDENGRMTRSVVDATHETPIGDELNLATAYVYDDDGRLFQTITDPTDPNVVGDELNLITEYRYDEAGRLEYEIVDPTDTTVAGDELNLTTRYLFDDAGRLEGKQLPDGAVWTYDYDDVGRLTDVTDPMLGVTHHDYDAAGRRTATIVDYGTGNLNLTTTTKYDAAGRVIETTDAEGVITRTTYDRASRVETRIVDPTDLAVPGDELNLTTSYEYFDNGSTKNITDPEGRVTHYEYDDAGRTKEITAPGPRATTFWYDENGRQIGSQSPSGLVTATTYDFRGLMTSTIVDPTDPNVTGVELNLTTSYVYDGAGRRTEVTNPRGFTTEYEYDRAGRLKFVTDPALPTHGMVELVYDDAGRITDVENARGYVSHFEYDEMGRVLEAIDPLLRTHAYEYNDLGQITRHLDPAGNDVRSFYDGANRLSEMNDGASTVYASFGYDAVGRTTSTTNYNGAIGYNYDAAGRVEQVTSPEGTVAYTHNNVGQRETMTLPGNRTVQHTYDTAGQLQTVTDWASRVTTYGYTADGLLETIDRANDVDTLYNYDDANRLEAISHFDPLDVALAEYAYDLDENGNRITAVITGSAVTAATETYNYDELDRLITWTYDDGVNPAETVEYGYDANGNRVSVTSGLTTTTATFDEADQLTDLGGLTLTYDPNGNRATSGSDTFVYDWANRLTQATVGGTSASFAYLADGTRQSKISGATTTDYLYDRTGGLEQVVDDGTTSYLNGVGSLAEIDNTSGDASSPLADGLGSVRARADETGAVVGTADWDAWGNLRASSGVSGAFGWTGEQRDAETGLTYLRSRYYASGSARFLTRDVISPNAGGTQGYNGYAYADGNPVTFTDPSGYGIVEVFAIFARVLDCIFYGECLAQRGRQNAPDPFKVAISGDAGVGHGDGSGVNVGTPAPRGGDRPDGYLGAILIKGSPHVPSPFRDGGRGFGGEPEPTEEPGSSGGGTGGFGNDWLDPGIPTETRPPLCHGVRGNGPFGQIIGTGILVSFATKWLDSCDVEDFLSSDPSTDADWIANLIGSIVGGALGALGGGWVGAAIGSGLGFILGDKLVDHSFRERIHDLYYDDTPPNTVKNPLVIAFYSDEIDHLPMDPEPFTQRDWIDRRICQQEQVHCANEPLGRFK